MNPKLSAKLYKDFPEMFGQRKLKKGQKCFAPIVFGCECGDGWYSLLRCICEVAQNKWCNHGTIVVMDQIKEKFGGLRFYYHTEFDPKMLKLDDETKRWYQHHRRDVSTGKLRACEPNYNVGGMLGDFHGVVQLAEHMSYIICEECGLPGKLRNDRSWILTLCDKCDARDKRKREAQNRRYAAEVARATKKASKKT